jgi:hypothetical protein
VRGGTVLGAGLATLLAAALTAQTPPPSATSRPKKVRTPGPARTPKAPLDFSGVWVLDAASSRGESSAMKGAVLTVRQNGNRIWIEPSTGGKPSPLMAEEIVVDGRPYEKGFGSGQKGTLTAAWGKDNQSLWLQIEAGTSEEPHTATQRMVWRLQDGGRIWTRQSWTVQKGGNKQSFLVFRKREAPASP